MEQFKHLLSVNFSKASYVFTFVLVFFISNAQDSKLFDYSWELEEIVTDEETFTASPYPDPEAEQTFMDYIYFYGSIENQNGSFMFGIYHNAMGDLIIFNNENSSFTIELYSTHFGEASPAEMFFNQYFVYENYYGDYMEETFHNPFTYAFREEEDKIYLDITNNEGSVATFWTSTLSTPSFEEIAFSFYPNPVKDRLHLENPQEEIQKIEIFDINGKKVLQSNFSNQAYIEVGHLARGVYMLKVDTKNGSVTKKLVKE